MARKIGRVRPRTISEVGTSGVGQVHRAGGRYCPACASIYHNHNHQYSASNANPVATAITSATTDTDTAATAIGSTANTLESDDDTPADMGRSNQIPAGCSDLNEDLPIGNSDLSCHSAGRLAFEVLNSAIQNLSLNNSQTSGLHNSLNLTTTLDANLPGYLRTNGTDNSRRTTNISGRFNINLRYTNHLATARTSRNPVAGENSRNRTFADAPRTSTMNDALHRLTSVADVGLDVMLNYLYNSPK